MTIVFLVLFGVAVLWMAVYGYKLSAKTAEDFMLAGRTLGLIVMFFFTLFAVSSAWTFYGYSGFLYRHGPGYVYFIWGSVLGFAILYMFLGPRLWAVTRMNRFLSPIEMMAVRYESKSLRLILAVLLLAFIVPYIAVQPKAVGLGFKAFTDLPVFVGVLYTIVLLIVIILLGGMRATAWVNVFLGTVGTVVFLGSLIWVVRKLFPQGLPQAAQVLSDKAPQLLSAPGPEGYFSHITMGGLFIVGMLAFSWPHIVIGTMTARDKVIFKWFPLLIIVAGGFFFYSIPFVWGAIVAPAISRIPGTLVPPVSGEASDNILQIIVSTYLPGWVSICVLMGVIAAAISTAAVQLMASAIFVSRDLIHGFIKPGATDRELVGWTRVTVVVVLMLALGVALWSSLSLAEYLTVIAVPGFAQWAPCLVGAVLWRRATGSGAIAGIITGTLILIAAFILSNLRVIGPEALRASALVSIILNSIVFVIVSCLTPKPSDEIQARFFDEVDDFLSAKA